MFRFSLKHFQIQIIGQSNIHHFFGPKVHFLRLYEAFMGNNFNTPPPWNPHILINCQRFISYVLVRYLFGNTSNLKEVLVNSMNAGQMFLHMFFICIYPLRSLFDFILLKHLPEHSQRVGSEQKVCAMIKNIHIALSAVNKILIQLP